MRKIIVSAFVFVCCLSAMGVNASFQPSFVSGQCSFDVPGTAGDVVCGTVTVPSNRKKTDSSSITISVAILKARKADASKVPVLYLHGGPGSSAIRTVPRFYNNAVREDQDLILFDQRGSQYSGKFCPEVEPELFMLMQQDLSLDAQASGLARSMVNCKQRAHENGIELSDYKTSYIADDVEDIRKALGVEKWSLWGVSYGTAVGMAVAHLYPETIHKLILDSVSLNSPNWRSKTGEHYEFSISRVFTLCDRDPKCKARFGNLRENYESVLKRLEKKPLSAVYGPDLDDKVVLNKHDFILIIHQLLYWPTNIKYIPLLIEVVNDGNSLVAASLTSSLKKNVLNKSFAVHYAVDCQGRGVQSVALPEGDNSVNSLFPLTAQYKRVCDAIGLKNRDLRAQPEKDGVRVKSQVSTLILTGSLDPITPPPTALEGAAEFEDAAVFELPYLGHAVSLRNDCARNVMLNFLADAPLNAACIDTIKPVSFETDVYLQPETYALANDLFIQKHLGVIVAISLIVLGLVYSFSMQVRLNNRDSQTMALWSCMPMAITFAMLVYLCALVGVIAYVGTTNKMLLLFGLPAIGSYLVFLLWSAFIGFALWFLVFCYQHIQRRGFLYRNYANSVAGICVFAAFSFVGFYGLF